MSLPNIMLNFKTKGASAISRSQKGVVAIILKDTQDNGLHTFFSIKDIPAQLSADNKAYIERCFMGNRSTPRKVYAYVLPTEAENFNDAFDALSLIKFDYLVGTPDIEPSEVQLIATWVKGERTSKHLIKAVLPNSPTDHEGIVNFTSEEIEADKVYTTAEYCSRIAGLIAGTPMTMSCTYAVLPEILAIKKLTKEQLDTKISNGEFIIFHDGEKVKVGRGVNSLKTTTSEHGEAFKKIKIVETVDMITSDIGLTLEDDYIGKYPNSYDDKCLLITAIKGYFEQLETEGILAKGKSRVEIDVEAQRNYIKSKGINVENMSEQEIKEANTDTKVFISAAIEILDAIEDITINVSM